MMHGQSRRTVCKGKAEILNDKKADFLTHTDCYMHSLMVNSFVGFM